MRRLFYFAPVATDTLNAAHGNRLHIGPADNKVFTVCRALRASACNAIIVSTVLHHHRGVPAAEAVRAGNVPFVRLFSAGKGLLKRFVSAFSLLAFSIRKVSAEDRVLLYNFFPEYIPSALYLKLAGRPAILDLEDGPRADERGARGFMVRTSYAIISKLVAKRYVVVSNRLARQLGLAPHLAVYGVAQIPKRADPAFRTFTGPRINVLFGGAILPDTGRDLFIAAVDLILERYADRRIMFHISGTYDYALFKDVADRVSASPGAIEMVCHRGLSLTDYKKMLEQIDIGLCLKLPSKEMGQTTFPSKVVEYASLGMLLITTPVSDVPDIFDGSSALLLRDESPAELAGAIVEAVDDVEASRARAAAGFALATRRFSPAQVSAELRDFIFE